MDSSGSGFELEELENKKRIEIKGTIFWGWGLEPGKLEEYVETFLPTLVFVLKLIFLCIFVYINIISYCSVPEGQFSMLEKLVFDDESSEEDDDEGDDTDFIDFTTPGNNFE